MSAYQQKLSRAFWSVVILGSLVGAAVWFGVSLAYKAVT